MARKPLTPAQIEARDSRRARFGQLVKDIADMTDEQRETLAASMPAVMTVDGRVLSLGNQLLIACQQPNATIVGGFNQWRQQGRHVRKGEHGLMIWAPTKGEHAVTQEPVEAPQPGDVPTSRPNFIMVTVFDISQTDAADELERAS